MAATALASWRNAQQTELTGPIDTKAYSRQNVTFSSLSGDAKLDAWLYLPKTASAARGNRPPIVLMAHGESRVVVRVGGQCHSTFILVIIRKITQTAASSCVCLCASILDLSVPAVAAPQAWVLKRTWACTSMLVLSQLAAWQCWCLTTARLVALRASPGSGCLPRDTCRTGRQPCAMSRSSCRTKWTPASCVCGARRLLVVMSWPPPTQPPMWLP